MKYAGGSPTNVAVAAARLGLDTAIITRTGDDPFGEFVHREIVRYGVSDEYVTAAEGMATPVVFCAFKPPDAFPLYFYRNEFAPDLLITPESLDLDAVRAARVHWSTLTGLCAEPSRSAHKASWAVRSTGQHTVLDLDYRPALWPSAKEAAQQARNAIEHVTIVIGNSTEFELAVGESDPHRAANAVLAAGPRLAIVKRGKHGVLARTRETTIQLPAHQVNVLNGLGAGDAFGGALCAGLVQDMPLERTIQLANAAGAIVTTRHGCAAAMPNMAEITAMLAADSAPGSRTRPVTNP